MRLFVAIICLYSLPSFAENVRIGEASGAVLIAVPMEGKGTWDDPKRPAFVRESGVPFRYQVSDDGTMALVEASPRNLAELEKLDSLVKKDGRAKLFQPGKDRKIDVETEFKKLKKDFDPAVFGRLGALQKALPAPAPGGGK